LRVRALAERARRWARSAWALASAPGLAVVCPLVGYESERLLVVEPDGRQREFLVERFSPQPEPTLLLGWAGQDVVLVAFVVGEDDRLGEVVCAHTPIKPQGRPGVKTPGL
jgi:hypothetical protein